MQSLKELLEKLWDGAISPSELEQLKALIEQESLFPNKEDESEIATQDHEWLARQKTIIDQKIKENNKRRTIPLFVKCLTAAAILAVFIILVVPHFYNNLKEDFGNLSESQQIHSSSQHFVENQSDTSLDYQLPDLSLVSLFPHSKISFDNDYNKDKRNIMLVFGAAIFSVQKNKLKPFIVQYKGTATTALGTKFKVDGRNTDQINIHLFEGKISVVSIGNQSGKINTILHPNQQLYIQIDANGMLKTIPNASTINKINTPLVEPSLLQSNKSQLLHTYSLKQCNLDSIIKLVKAETKSKIIIGNNDFSDKWFTGKLDFTKDWKDQIRTIGTLNGLNIEIVHDTIKIETQPNIPQ